VVGPLAQDLACQRLSHAQTGLVHRDVVQQRVRPGEIDELENAGRQFLTVRAAVRMQLSVHRDEHRLAGAEVALKLESEHVESHAFRRQRVFAAPLRLAVAEYHRPDSVRVPEPEQTMAADQRDGRIGAPTALVNAVDRREYVGRAQPVHVLVLQFVGKHVEQHFRVRFGVQVTPVAVEQLLRELIAVDQIAVVAKGDPVGRVDVERLRFGGIVHAGRRITHVADADAPGQAGHVSRFEDIPDQAIALVKLDLVAVERGDARGVLAAVLQHGQRVVHQRCSRALADDSHDSAHDETCRCPPHPVARHSTTSQVIPRLPGRGFATRVRYRPVPGLPRPRFRCPAHPRGRPDRVVQD
jgi:hypothetical protein